MFPHEVPIKLSSMSYHIKMCQHNGCISNTHECNVFSTAKIQVTYSSNSKLI
jgi:hypothetical protein